MTNIPKSSKKIIVDKAIWYWKGTRSGIFLINPAGEKRFISYKMMGYNWSDVERAQDHHRFHITPKEVEYYIRSL